MTTHRPTSRERGAAVAAQHEEELKAVQTALADPDVALPAEQRAKPGPKGTTVELKGQHFKLAKEVGAMALMQFAASGDLDVNDPQGMAAMYWLLQDIIAEEEWSAFQAHARKTKAKGDELLDVINAAMEAFAARPTKAPANSSSGSTETSPT